MAVMVKNILLFTLNCPQCLESSSRRLKRTAIISVLQQLIAVKKYSPGVRHSLSEIQASTFSKNWAGYLIYLRLHIVLPSFLVWRED